MSFIELTEETKVKDTYLLEAARVYSLHFHVQVP
jgi:hypothetical protein